MRFPQVQITTFGLAVLLVSACTVVCTPASFVDVPGLEERAGFAGTNIELDLIFPRNATYGLKKRFPIVFGLQNAAAAYNYGWHLAWQVRRHGTGYDAGGVDSGLVKAALFESAPAPSDPYFIVNSTNWGLDFVYDYTSVPGTYILEWRLGLSTNCSESGTWFNTTTNAIAVTSSVHFTVVVEQAGVDQAIDLAAAGPCPLSAGLIEIAKEYSTGCPNIGKAGQEATPCAINLDDGNLVSSLSAAFPAGATETPNLSSAVPSTTTTKGSAGSPATPNSAALLMKRGAPHQGALLGVVGAGLLFM